MPRLELADPELASLKSAARAAIVMPAVFAVADKVIHDPQTATFAAFGSFAMLVLVDFTGPLRSRFVAYISLACVGAANVVLGTLCSRNDWLAAAAMAAVGFAILFSGVVNGYFAAAGTSALLTFVLPVTIPAPASANPARLEGWALAALAGICAHALLWPARPRATLRREAARACDALAELAEHELAGDRTAVGGRAHAAREAVSSLRRNFLATPHRPTGPTGPTAALASLVDEFDWLLSFLAPSTEMPRLALCREENAEAMAATVAVLRTSAARLDGRDERPDLDRLDDAREALAQALARRIPELPAVPDDEALGSALEPAFRIRALSYAARQVAGYALLATGADAPELDELDVASRDTGRPARAALQATERLAVEHASARSVWFRNSLSLLAEYGGGFAGYSVGAKNPSTSIPFGGYMLQASYFLTGERMTRRVAVVQTKPYQSFAALLPGPPSGSSSAQRSSSRSALTSSCSGRCCRWRSCSPRTRLGRSRSQPGRPVSPSFSSSSSI